MNKKQKKSFHLPKLDFTDNREGFAILFVGILATFFMGLIAEYYALSFNWIYWSLGIGLFVGILNMFHREGVLFLITTLVMAFMLNILLAIELLPNGFLFAFNSVQYFLAVAAIAVSLKVIYALAIKGMIKWSK